ncbi:MAG: hypothetical protein IPN29_07435 [Saprospiraceae bacterium]|nr:hypothetical protein [Saprospiraceae bacterium]
MEPSFYEPFHPISTFLIKVFLAYNENKEGNYGQLTALKRVLPKSEHHWFPGNIDAIHMVASDSLIFILLSDFSLVLDHYGEVTVLSREHLT